MRITDENVIGELQKKNPAALEYLIDTYGGTVYGLVRRILQGSGSIEDIEECVSDVYVALWENIERYDARRGSIKTWMLILAKYKALDYRRKLARACTAVEATEKELGAQEYFMPSNNVEEEVMARFTKQQLLSAINSLGEMDKKIFMQRYFLYQSIEWIAHNYGLTRKAVDNRLWRMRKLLSEKLLKEGEEVVI